MKKIKSTMIAVAVAGVTVFGMNACDHGQEPGETSVDQGDFYEDQGGMVVPDEGDEDQDRYSDTTQEAGERYYENNEEGTLGDGAYDGPGDGIERDEIQE